MPGAVRRPTAGRVHCDNRPVSAGTNVTDPAAASPLIVVAGEALVDLIVRPDGEIVSVAGGSPYNAVRAIARLGVAASWVGGLSSDRFGRMLENGLAGDGVGRDLVQRTDLPTTLALAELGADGSASYRFYTQATSAPAVLPGPLAGGIPASARAFLTGSLGLVLEPMASTLEAIAEVVPPDRIVMLDPNARPSITPDPDAWRARMTRIMARADIVKASTEDLEFLRPGESPEAAAAWIKAHGPAVVLVTDGSRPVRVLVGDAFELVPAPPVTVVDTVGAGDTFGGAFLACLVHEGVGPDGMGDATTILRAVRFAVRASAFVCGRAGANPPTLAELGGWPTA
jgi:fructokinase